MINLNRLAIFAAVAETGSFTAAADRLELSKAVVSQHVARLEAELRATLFIRSTRRVTLTEAGHALYDSAVRIQHEVDAVGARIAKVGEVPAGTLRLTASKDFCEVILAPALARFAERNPQLSVDLVASDAIVSLVAGGFDLGIRVGWPRDSQLHSTRLGTFTQRLVAAPDYLERAGVPSHPRELADHRFIELSLLRSPLLCTFSVPGGKNVTVRMKSSIRADSPSIVRTFALAGAGVAVLPDYLADDDIRTGQLIHLLPQFTLPEGGIYAVYPFAPRLLPAKARLFIQFLGETLRARTD